MPQEPRGPVLFTPAAADLNFRITVHPRFLIRIMLALVSTVPSYTSAPLAGNGAVQTRSSVSMMARKAKGATKADLIVLPHGQKAPSQCPSSAPVPPQCAPGV